MELHAVISERPIIAGTWVLFRHDAVNSECLETCGERDGPVSNKVSQEAPTMTCFKPTHFHLRR